MPNEFEEAGSRALKEVDWIGAMKAQINAEYRQRTRKSATLHEAALSVLPGGDTRTVTYFQPYPTYVAKGQSCRVTDVDGNLYIDFLNNYTSLIHGHAHPKINKAVLDQLAKGTAYGTPIELQTRLAHVLRERVASLERVRFCNSGTEATMSAIRAAKAFTSRNKIIKIEGGYHGSHDAAEISVTPLIENAGPAEAPYSVFNSPGLFRGILDDVLVAPFNNIEAISGIINRHQHDLAAVILEPVLGGAGVIPAEPEYLRFVREATRSCGALLIFDEVVTLRLAYGGAQELYAVTPDLTAMGKIIGGGLPVGAFGGRTDVMEQFNPQHAKLRQSGTFNGNAVTMAAGLAALELLTREEIARINQLGECLRTGLRKAFVEIGMEGQVTGIGSLSQIHFTTGRVFDYRSAEHFTKELPPLVHLALLNRGIFTAARGEWAISTPMGNDEIATAVEAFYQVLEVISSPAK